MMTAWTFEAPFPSKATHPTEVDLEVSDWLDEENLTHVWGDCLSITEHGPRVQYTTNEYTAIQGLLEAIHDLLGWTYDDSLDWMSVKRVEVPDVTLG